MKKLIALVTVYGVGVKPIARDGAFSVENDDDAESLIERGFAKAAPEPVEPELSEAEKAAAEKAAAEKAAAEKAEAEKAAAGKASKG